MCTTVTKMALKVIITSSPINVLKLNCNRNLLSAPHFFKSNSFILRYYSSNNAPVKYTATKASKVKSSENIDFFAEEKDDRPKYQPLVMVMSLSIFLIYFCLLREENDIDERLKGNTDFTEEATQLIQLQLKLAYCERNNLPTKAILEKIEELKKKVNKEN